MKYLAALLKEPLAERRILVRVDFNIEGLHETFRLESSLPTIRALLKKRARVVLLSHRGRPPRPANVGAKEFSLRIALPFLKKRLGTPVSFLPSFDFNAHRAAIKKSRMNLFLLENLRFLPKEEQNDPSLGKTLAAMGDAYVNDAFSVSHRKNASVVQLPRFCPSYAGFLLEKEIENLSRALRGYKRPLVVLLGGAKVSDKLGLIKNFENRAARFLIGGAVANTFMRAEGIDIGSSSYEPSMIPTVRRLLRSPLRKKLVLPLDIVLSGKKIVDIGPKSAALFSSLLARAGTIIWNGPLGFFERPAWAKGSRTVLRAIAASKAFSIVGGGETTELVTMTRMEKRIGFVSTGGGAMLAFLGGERMPGLDALNRSSQSL